jgi:hypothetical protein
VDAQRLFDWCVAFAAMTALELASQDPGRSPRLEVFVQIASQA